MGLAQLIARSCLLGGPELDRVEDDDVCEVRHAIDGDDVQAEEDGLVGQLVLGNGGVPVVEVAEGLVRAEARSRAEAHSECCGKEESIIHGNEGELV